MKLLNSKKIGSIFALVIGALYLATTVWGYYPAFQPGQLLSLGEWCCISGTVGGVLYVVSFFLWQAKRKALPAVLFLDLTVTLTLILIATAAMQLNLDGAFRFIHIINPALVLAHFFLFCDCREIASPKLLWSSLVFPVFYIVFAATLLCICGEAPFPARMIFQQGGFLVTLGIIASLCAFILALAAALLWANKRLHSFFESKK